MDAFDEVVAQADGPGPLRLTDHWMQGRTAFGGLATAWAVRAMRRAMTTPRPLLSVDVAFVGPMAAGRASAQGSVLREGKHVTQAEATIAADEDIVVRAQGVFGTDRSSRITVAPDVPAPSKPLADAQRFPFVPGLTPQFTQHFEFRLTEGELPFSGSTEATIGGYVRHLTEASGVEALLALIDAWPAPVLSLGRAPFFASTIRWSAQLVAEPPRWPEYFWFRSDCVSARGGYATTVGRLYADDVLVAFSDQLVAVFDAPATSPG